MYQYRVDDDTSKKAINFANVDNKEKSIDDVINSINKLNKIFSTNENIDISKPDFKRLEEIDFSDNNLKSNAENELYDYKNTSIEKINNDAVKNLESLKDNADTLKENSVNQKSNLKSYYDDARENTSNSALKRGLARSSIVINLLDAFNKDEIENYNNIDKELTNSLNAIDFEINSLNVQKENALNDFNVTYAVKLNSKINELKNKMLEQQNEIIKYNNEISEKENQFNIDYEKLKNSLDNADWDKEQDIFKITRDFGYNTLNTYKQNRINDFVSDYFSNISQDEINNALDNEYFKNALGSYYSKIYEKYKK